MRKKVTIFNLFYPETEEQKFISKIMAKCLQLDHNSNIYQEI